MIPSEDLCGAMMETVSDVAIPLEKHLTVVDIFGCWQ